MTKYLLSLLIFLAFQTSVFSQKVQIQIVSPPSFKGRKAVLLTREKGFAAIVHSIKLYSEIFNLDIDNDLVPDLYQLHVSQVKGSLFFFLEPGIKIDLDTTDIGLSVVSKSKSTQEWQLFQNAIQKPYEEKIKEYSTGEVRARRLKSADSLNYFVEKQAIEKEELTRKTGEFIAENSRSYVSLYLLKINWYALKNDKLLEKLDVSLSRHRTYKYLQEKNNKSEKIGVAGRSL